MTGKWLNQSSSYLGIQNPYSLVLVKSESDLGKKNFEILPSRRMSYSEIENILKYDNITGKSGPLLEGAVVPVK